LKTDQSIVVIGAGGIGFHVCKMLAMAGIKNIYVFDPDIFEEHNLNRIDAPTDVVGLNKADVVEMFVSQMRPDCDVMAFPFKFKPDFVTMTEIDWIVDCTDVHAAQVEHQGFADTHKTKYFKAGYDGESMSINNRVGMWDTDETPDGYQVTPSWAVPTMMIACLAVGKVLKYVDGEMGTNLSEFYTS
jgi:molybdopterin/thiamine biosynthesis adenylyltransferase